MALARFLFAALNILEPLYDACLERMEEFVAELDRSEEPHHTEKFRDFREILAEVGGHASREYYIYKSIIINNLYGVDIMDEAVEICKLRLFLKLVAQLEDASQIEPLPDIDFNIRAGNTLVGFTNMGEIRRAIAVDDSGNARLPLPEDAAALEQIEERADMTDRAFQQFRLQQTQFGGIVDREDKIELRARLSSLSVDLDRYLARQYGIDRDNIIGSGDYESAFNGWRSVHHPFHWLAEFKGVFAHGGFDVIIGNPPYLESREVQYTLRGFETAEVGAIHAAFVERSKNLLDAGGAMSMIVPMSIISTQRMQAVHKILEASRNVWYANFSWRPGKLFDTVNRALTIYVASPSKTPKIFTTCYQKWTSHSRDVLMDRISFVEVPKPLPSFWVPKLGSELERSILAKLSKVPSKIRNLEFPSEYRIYYRATGGLYWKVFTDFPPMFKVNGVNGHSTRETTFSVRCEALVLPVIAALSSDLFWWWYTITSNCRDLNPMDIREFPFPEPTSKDANLALAGRRYVDDIALKSEMRPRKQRQTGYTETQSFKIQHSKPLINQIDTLLAEDYQLSPEEMDYVVNYDIKYRVDLNRDLSDE